MSTKHKAKLVTHEAFIQQVQALVTRREAITDKDRKALAHIKLTYGTGSESGLRGVTWYDKWDCGCDAHGKRVKGRKAVIGHLVCLVATGQESVCQLIGTTLHELAHAIAGPGFGHGPEWKAACERVGLPAAVNGTEYTWDKFDPAFVAALQRLPVPTDGMPRPLARVIQGLRAQGVPLPPGLASGPLPAAPKLRPCGAGFGTRGGQSRGVGAGSRYLKWHCECKPKPVIVRHAGAALKAHCDTCGAAFKLDSTSLPPAHGMGASGQGVAAATARKHGARKPLAKRKPKAKGKPGPKAGPKAKASVPRVHAKPAPAPGPSPKAMARRFAAKVAQAPLAPKPSPGPEPQEAGELAGQTVYHKPAAAFCEAHNGPASLCGCVA